jgi:hypothetical protein
MNARDAESHDLRIAVDGKERVGVVRDQRPHHQARVRNMRFLSGFGLLGALDRRKKSR